MLPVEQLLPQIISTLQQHSGLIICAPPGSGKTTKVAPALLDAGLCNIERKTFLLQPRRVAARATAERIAFERDLRIGEEVGYQVRFDSKVSKRTAIIVATEGILLRRIAEDPTLEDVGTVVLDEFHERSLNADLLLSMLRRIQRLVRDDLRIVVMSATLDSKPLEEFLQVPAINSEGTLHPVEIQYRPARNRQPLKQHVAETVELSLQKRAGDILVFLPGVGEIRQVQDLLETGTASTQDYEVHVLHGSLPLEQQQRVLRPSDRRRVILSTNVAETSLTIDGITTVIDSGLARVLRYDPSVGLDRLQLESISQSSATQRAGRAGRLTAGTCVRLWDEKSQKVRPAFHEPEIRRVDLAGAALQLYSWGEPPGEFPWFEAPHEDSLRSATNLLEQLGAVSEKRITDLGNRMSSLPTTPRLARMLAEANFSPNATDADARKVVAFVAAMLSERDPFLRNERGTSPRAPQAIRNARWSCDVTQRLEALRAYFERGQATSEFGTIHRGAANTIRRVAEQLGGTATRDLPWPKSLDEMVPQLLLVAFPDRLAKRRKIGDTRGRMVGGRGVRLAPQSGVADGELFLCIDVDGKGTEATVRQASHIHREWLPEEMVDERTEMFFNPSRKSVEARLRRYWFDLMLDEQTSSIVDTKACSEMLFNEASKDMDRVLPTKDAAFNSFLMRMQCLAEWEPKLDLPTDSRRLLLDVLREVCVDKRSFAEVQAAPWLDWLKVRLTPEQQQAVERECPDRIEVPSGNRLKLKYEPGKSPVLEVRIQEVFSWTETPRVAFGKVPVLLHLLAPNFRPQQVTDDLASFWANTYGVVRKELRRRYPKHSWPEDPLTAKPESKGGRRR